ncbi:MAG: hypothetical protein P9X24_09165 [Candidatus Hatepunaea meridiana]|nr:hypothetical protein [Candidatus Hatepunaea meridiana]
MNRNIIVILLIASLITVGNCQISVNLPNKSAGEMLAGEHFPVIYTGQGLIKGAANSYTTSWCQVGFSSVAENDDNRNIGIFNPEIFSVGIKLGCNGDGDSARVSSARFECAYDTTWISFWNADSSNQFIESNNYSCNQYGIWRFEALDDTSRQWLFPLRVMIGGYIRLVFTSDIDDTCQVDWTLICEH